MMFSDDSIWAVVALDGMPWVDSVHDDKKEAQKAAARLNSDLATTLKSHPWGKLSSYGVFSVRELAEHAYDQGRLRGERDSEHSQSLL